jgi:hypothetical protein
VVLAQPERPDPEAIGLLHVLEGLAVVVRPWALPPGRIPQVEKEPNAHGSERSGSR